ncbi:hypothetical protein HT031_005234 [Scenedesmus sp. PABB004]|nr:hypothetical protein HT031_005234 [Scenedesmus sp. PABB004]
MVYIRDGQVQERPGFRGLSSIAELFMAFINFIVVFFQTILDPSAASNLRPRGGGGGGSGGSSGGSRRPGGGRGGGGGGGGGRIVGMDNLKADHAAKCGGGG